MKNNLMSSYNSTSNRLKSNSKEKLERNNRVSEPNLNDYNQYKNSKNEGTIENYIYFDKKNNSLSNKNVDSNIGNDNSNYAYDTHNHYMSSFDNYTRKNQVLTNENQEKDLLISQLRNQINILQMNQKEFEMLQINHQKLLFE